MTDFVVGHFDGLVLAAVGIFFFYINIFFSMTFSFRVEIFRVLPKQKSKVTQFSYEAIKLP